VAAMEQSVGRCDNCLPWAHRCLQMAFISPADFIAAQQTELLSINVSIDKAQRVTTANHYRSGGGDVSDESPISPLAPHA